jgi:hypothetical protein
MRLISCDREGCTDEVFEFDERIEQWLSVDERWYCPAHKAASGGSVGDRDDVGFTGPEDGSEDRYRARAKRRPWLEHSVWWVIHNAVAHLLIAFFPFRPFFRFHDWTSRKMHGAS